jgi:aspartyl-tRNA(Asn)/glutamyl-tRNA(Gln) amidotransferase subunit B
LPVFSPDPEFLRSVEEGLVELPLPRARRLQAEYGLSGEQAELVCEEKAQADYFEEAVAGAVKRGLPKEDAAGRVVNLLSRDIKHILGREGLEARDLASIKLSPARLASVVVLNARGKVSGKNARQALEAALAEDKDPELIIRERGWDLISDPARIALAVGEVYRTEEPVFAELRNSGEKGPLPEKRRQTLTAFLVGKVLAATGGRADPKIAGSQIEALIRKDKHIGIF